MMLNIDTGDLEVVLEAFGIQGELVQVEELLRYDYEDEPARKNVRLILKCQFAGRDPLVVKFRHEADVTKELLTEQIQFSEHLTACGVRTARFYRAGFLGVMQRFAWL